MKRRDAWRTLAGATAVVLGLAGCTVGSGLADADLYDALTDRDVALAVDTLQQALEVRPNGEAVTWRNEASGHAGSIEPVSTWVTTGGYACRAYVERLQVDGREGRFRNTACRDEDGRWVWVG
jgi:surface antigen